MKNLLKFIAFLLLVASLISCRPFSKESYLEKYDKFITEVSEKGAEYTEEEWEKADEKYVKFKGDWYEHFKDDLTWQEKLIIAKYGVQYNFYQESPNVINLYETYLKGDYEKIKEKLKYYKENNMQDDIDQLVEKTKELSDSSSVYLEKIIQEIEEQ